MEILIVNDDGIESDGIKALVNTFRAEHKLTVVAPQRQMSGMSRSITIRAGLDYIKVDIHSVPAYAVNGTPADCVKFAFLNLGVKPDLVISGINYGENTGSDLLYSGTVAAAMEGSFLGAPSLAISCAGSAGDNFDFGFITKFLQENFNKLLECALPDRVVNINFPSKPESEIRGVKVTRQGLFNMQEFYVVGADGHYRLNGNHLEFLSKQYDCDIKFLFENYITVTPLSHDITDYSRLSVIEDILK